MDQLQRHEHRTSRSLKYSVADGAFYSAMVGFGESLFSLFAIFMNATGLQLGLLGSLPQMVGSVVQVFARELLKFFSSRKQFVLLWVTVQASALMMLPFALLLGDSAFYYLLVFVCIYYIGALVPNPAWTSWMGDLVPENIRGSYFGRRNAVAGLVTFIAMSSAGYILSVFVGIPWYGFMISFVLAGMMRLISGVFLKLQHEPQYFHNIAKPLTLRKFIREADLQNYGLFLGFSSLTNFAVFIASPFFVAYMHETLGLGAGLILLINGFMILSKCLFGPIWGKFCDRYGSRKVFALMNFMLGAVPLVWLVSPEVWWLFIAQGFSGMVWAGYEVSSSNFVFEMVPKNKRLTSASYANLFNSIGIVSGGVVGGVLVTLAPFGLNPFLFVMGVSGFLRYMVSAVFVPFIKETRKVEPVSYERLLLNVFTAELPSLGIINFMIPRHFKAREEPKVTIIVDDEDGRKGEPLNIGLKEYKRGLYKKK